MIINHSVQSFKFFMITFLDDDDKGRVWDGTSVKKKVTQAPASFQVIARACRDPKDNMVLECCDEAGADTLITEDDRGGLRYYNIVLQSTARAGNGKGKSDKKVGNFPGPKGPKVGIYNGPRQAD